MHQIGALVAAQLVADVVLDDFRVGLADQMVIGEREQLGPELGEVGQLAVEREAEPFPLAAVMPLERLSIAAVVRAAGGVADVADGRPARVLLHDAVVFGLVIEAEGLDDRPDLAERVDDLFAAGVVGGEPRRQLAAVLHVQEHSRH